MQHQHKRMSIFNRFLRKGRLATFFNLPNGFRYEVDCRLNPVTGVVRGDKHIEIKWNPNKLGFQTITTQQL